MKCSKGNENKTFLAVGQSIEDRIARKQKQFSYT